MKSGATFFAVRRALYPWRSAALCRSPHATAGAYLRHPGETTPKMNKAPVMMEFATGGMFMEACKAKRAEPTTASHGIALVGTIGVPVGEGDDGAAVGSILFSAICFPLFLFVFQRSKSAAPVTRLPLNPFTHVLHIGVCHGLPHVELL